MKCHYEVLGVEANCSSDDLKKAYRKLALEWHPDKNLNRLEEAKENFQLIQQAYDILSDPQERAWYDRHKEDILRGGAEQAYKDDCLDVYQYFNTSCYKGYNDEEKGFYTVYRQVFEKITAEDKPFMDEDDDMEIPQFGYSYSSYEEVVHSFYAYWQSYCTAKTFSWVDKYDIVEARKTGACRQVIRAMEKENKKLRDMAKKLRNEEVRELVAFVRKRDKRVQAAKKRMEEMKAEKAKKVEEQRRKQVQERQKAFEEYKETEWSSMSQFENHLNEIESSLDATYGSTGTSNENDDDNDSEDLGDLYCVACEKDFRSEKAFINHENSKKHKENVALLKTLMVEEEAMANLGVVDDKNDQGAQLNSDQEENETSDALLGELIKNSTKSKKKKKKTKNSSVSHQKDVETLDEIELKMGDIQINDCDDEAAQNEVDTDAPENNSSPKSEEMCDVSSKNKAQNVKKQSNKSASSKKKEKKEKAKKSESVIEVEESDGDETEKPNTICSTCKNNYSSRNKLFEHLKQTGHAAYKSENTASSAPGKKQRKKKL